jgi:hypothetical protein
LSGVGKVTSKPFCGLNFTGIQLEGFLKASVSTVQVIDHIGVEYPQARIRWGIVVVIL